MDSKGVFYQQPNASDGAPLQPLEVTLFNPALRQGQVREHRLDRQWQVRRSEGRLYRRLPGAQRRSGRRLHELRARRICRLLPVLRSAGSGNVRQRSVAEVHLLLAERHLARDRAQRAPAARIPPEHAGRVAAARDRRRVLGGQRAVRPDRAGCTRPCRPAPRNATPGTPGNGNTGCLSNVGTFPGTTVQNPGVQSDNTSFYQDQLRETKQTAFFASVDFDLIPKVLTLTAGTRHFLFQNSMAGSVLSSFGCFEAGRAARRVPRRPRWPSYNLNAENLRDSESGWKSRANLTWHVTPDVMVYYTFSQGFRPGGFNQNGGFFAYAPGTGWRGAVRGSQVLLIRQADEQRDRLEDGILRPSPAVERRRCTARSGTTPRSLSSTPVSPAISSSTPTARTSSSRASRLRSWPAW